MLLDPALGAVGRALEIEKCDPKHPDGFEASRWRRALLTAALSDVLGFGATMLPPLRWLLDAAIAVVLLGVLGFRWPLLFALAIEAVPVLQVFPAWILVVVALASTETRESSPGTGSVDGGG